MNGVLYTLRLLEPVLANNLAGDANSARTLPYIPGGLVRGALIGPYRTGKRGLDAGDSAAQRLFFDGQTRYLHAYPLLQDDDYGLETARALPAPLAWRKEKGVYYQDDEAVPVFDLSIAWPDEETEIQGLGEDPFGVLQGSTACWRESPQQVNVHTQRDAEWGRAHEGEGGGAVYRYEALAPGTRWRGVILTADESDGELIKGWLEGRTLRLGKARSAGYGRALVEAVEVLAEDWKEYDGNAPSDLAEFKLTFLSDAILRDGNGQPSLDPAPALSRKFPGHAFEVTQQFRQGQLTGGFNRKWGLPLPQVNALAAGSVFVVTVTPPLSQDQAQRLWDEGLGERRAEGLGRVALDWHNNEEFFWQKIAVEEEKPSAPAITLAPDSLEMRAAEWLLPRMLRLDLDRKLRDAVLATQIAGEIPNSQLARWRTIIRSALAEPKAEKRLERLAILHAAETKKNSAAWKRMYRARVRQGTPNNDRLTEWLWNGLTKEGWLWPVLATKDNSTPSLALGKAVSYKATREMEIEYRLRLMDGVLARKAHEQRGKK